MTASTTGLLTGKVAVVTGGAQGLGKAIARAFVEAGARVVIGDLDGQAAMRAALDLGPTHVAIGLGCNVVELGQVEHLCEKAVEVFGSLDVMVNNAGITRDATMRKMTEDQFDQVISVHLRGTWNGLKTAAGIMRTQTPESTEGPGDGGDGANPVHASAGSIINVSSISGKVGNPGQTNYSAAKAGIVGMTKAAAKEVGFAGVRVNAIQPGLIHTAMTEAMPPEVLAERLTDVPLGRVGEPEEVASVAVFLASDMSSYLTGTVIEIAGGRNI